MILAPHKKQGGPKMPSIGNKPPKKIKKIPHGTLIRMLKKANRTTDDARRVNDELNGMLVNVNRQRADEIHIVVGFVKTPKVDK